MRVISVKYLFQQAKDITYSKGNPVKWNQVYFTEIW